MICWPSERSAASASVVPTWASSSGESAAVVIVTEAWVTAPASFPATEVAFAEKSEGISTATE